MPPPPMGFQDGALGLAGVAFTSWRHNDAVWAGLCTLYLFNARRTNRNRQQTSATPPPSGRNALYLVQFPFLLL